MLFKWNIDNIVTATDSIYPINVVFEFYEFCNTVHV